MCVGVFACMCAHMYVYVCVCVFVCVCVDDCKCAECSHELQNWVCLKCHKVLCGR